MKTSSQNIGILFVNIGTPSQPTIPEVRKYLAEFLADPRVVMLPRFLWLPILHGLVLRTRPRRSARAYQKIWTEDGSPLLVISKQKVAKLAEKLHSEPDNQINNKFFVSLGMRYGTPSIADGLRALRDNNCQRIIVFSAYPQYSSATTASTLDAVGNELRHWKKIPELRFINSYYDNAHYIDALAMYVKQAWQQQPPNEHLLFSFHGLPQEFIDAGDPYRDQCYATTKLLAKKLQLNDSQWTVAFQSRLGPTAWLKPYCDETLRNMPSQGIKKLDVICPGFSSDCLETLEEMAMQNKDMFMRAGGEQFRYIPALNAHDEHISALAKIIHHHTQGWHKVSQNQIF